MNRFLLCVLTLIISILSTRSYSKSVVAFATNEDFEAIGLSSTKTDFPAGTVIVDSEVGSLELAYDDAWGILQVANLNGYKTVKVGDSGYFDLGAGAVGNSNPTFTSYENGVMSAGAVFKIKAKQDGWMTVFTKMNPNKQYVVFEDQTGPVPYTLGVAGEDYKINYTLPFGEDGYIDFGSSYASKFFILSENEIGEVLGHRPQFPYIVAGLDNSPSQSVGYLTFEVYADCNYYVAALGSKMVCGGFVFNDSKNEPVVTFAATADLPAVTFETRKSDEPVEQSKLPTPTASFKEKKLTLLCSDSQAKIRYTKDGTDPTMESTLYRSPLSLTEDCIVKFFAHREGYKDTDIVTFNFIKSNYQVAKPTISYNPDSKLISITCPTAGAEIRYTTDGNEPTSSTGTVYTGPFAVTGNFTYIAKAFHNDLFDSESVSESVSDLQLPLPTASFKEKKLTLSCSDSQAKIRYTNDGTDPTMVSTLYRSPLSLSEDCIVKFFAYREGYQDTDIVTFNFIKSNYQAAKPTISYNPDSKLISITCPTAGAEIRYTTDGNEPTSSTGTVYTGPFAVTGNFTCIAKAFHSNLIDSEIVSEIISGLKVPTPTATFSNKQLTLSCSDANAVIRYTTNGNDPTRRSTLYESPLSLTDDCTVKFFAYREGYEDSEKASFEFRRADYQVAKPTISYNPDSKLLSISCPTAGAEIRYTTDGNEPTSSTGTVYAGPFAVTGNFTYIAKAFRSDLFDSESVSENVSDLQVPKPTASFVNKQLTLSCADENAQIRYTTDGTDPTSNSTLYESPLSLTDDCIVKFFAYREGYKDSEIESFNFLKSNYQVAKPSISFDSNSRLLIISCPTEGAQIRYTTDGSEPTSSSNLYTGAISVESNINIRARGFKDGLFDSEITYFSTTIEQVETPTASFSRKKLTLSCSDPKGQIYYAIISSTAAKEWTLYDNPLELKDDCTINFYAKREGYNDSETASFEFILAEHQVSQPILENDFRGRKITITHPQSLPVKVTIDGITEEEKETPFTIDVSTSMTSIAAIAVATDENLYDSNATRENIRFHKKPDMNYNGHTLTVAVAKDDPIKTEAEVICKFKDNIIGQGSNILTTQISDFGKVYMTVESDEAFSSTQEELTIDVFNTGRIAGAKNEHTLSEAFGTWDDNEEDYTYLRIVGEVNKEDLQLLATLPNLTTLHFDHSLMTPDRCDNIFANTMIETLYFANSFPEGILMGMPRLSTVVWGKTNYGMTDGHLSEVGNPNILLWVTKKELAPKDARNIVIFQDPGDGKATDPLVSEVEGTAEKITLQVGYPFNVHKSIHVKEVEVVKDFTLPTQKGVTQGWETLILPFAPDAIRHETKGNLVPFKAWESTNMDAKPFWLYKATENGWEEADALNACEPYVISMPNNPIYMDAFNLPGKVTFSAENIVLGPKSLAPKASSWVNSIELAGTFMPVEETDILSLNVNASNDGELRGSAFVDYDITLPFGAYVRNVGDMKRIPLFAEGSGVELPSIESESLKIDTSAPGTIRIYSNCGLTIGIYTPTGVMVRSVKLTPGEIVEIENLTKGIYICNGVKVMVD